MSKPEAAVAPAFAGRIALFYTALFLVAGTKLPYLPLWLDWRGLTASEIAGITAAPLFLRIFAGPLIAMLADSWGDRRRAIVALAGLSLGGLGLLLLAHGFWPILVVTLLTALATTGLMPLAETLAMSGVRRAGLDYGRMRLWGSLSFIAAGFIAAAAIRTHGPGAVVWLLIAGGVLTLAVALILPADPEGKRPASAGLDVSVLVRTFRTPRFPLFLLAAGAVQSSHAVFYTFGVLEWQRQGIDASWSAGLWAIGVVAEIALFAFSRTVVERVGAELLLLAGGVAALVRWTAMAFDPPLAALVPLQALHGLTFGAAHIGALHVMSRTVPASEAATAQALYASVTSGIGLGLATFLSGPVYTAAGGRAYAVMAVLGVIGTVAMLVMMRRPKSQPQP